MHPSERFQFHKYGDGYVSPATAGARVKDVDMKEGIVQVYFSSFGNIDSHNDIIVPGAFSKTIREWGPNGRGRIAHLKHHNPTTIIGVIRELEEDQHGLLATSKILGQNHTDGRNTLIEYDEGALKEHSIGFDLMDWEWDEVKEAFILKEIRLFEGSAVTWGANMDTPLVDLKSLQDDPRMLRNMAARVKAIERVLKRGITDDRAIELEAQLDMLENAIGEVRKALPQNDGPKIESVDEALKTLLDIE